MRSFVVTILFSISLAPELLSQVPAQATQQAPVQNTVKEFDFSKFDIDKRNVPFLRISDIGGSPILGTSYQIPKLWGGADAASVYSQNSGLKNTPEVARGEVVNSRSDQIERDTVARSLSAASGNNASIALDREMLQRYVDRFTYQIYTADAIERMLKDIRLDMMTTISTQVMQFSIKSDQAASLADISKRLDALESSVSELKTLIKAQQPPAAVQNDHN